MWIDCSNPGATQIPVAAASWTEIQLDSPPGGFVSIDTVNIYFEVDKHRSPITIKQLTMNACIRTGLFTFHSSI